MKYQVVEIIEREPFRTTVSEPMDFRPAAILFGQRWYQVLELFLIDDQGNQIAHHATSPTERAPVHILHAAGMRLEHIVEVDEGIGNGDWVRYLDEDGKIVTLGKNAHAFTSAHEAREVAARFNEAEAERQKAHEASPDGHCVTITHRRARVRTSVRQMELA